MCAMSGGETSFAQIGKPGTITRAICVLMRSGARASGRGSKKNGLRNVPNRKTQKARGTRNGRGLGRLHGHPRLEAPGRLFRSTVHAHQLPQPRPLARISSLASRDQKSPGGLHDESFGEVGGGDRHGLPSEAPHLLLNGGPSTRVGQSDR